MYRSCLMMVTLAVCVSANSSLVAQEMVVTKIGPTVTITGTSKDDWVTLEREGNSLTIFARTGTSRREYTYSILDVEKIRFYGGYGNDRFQHRYTSSVTHRDVVLPRIEAYGGPGNDRLYGSHGPDILRGGPGVDTLSALGGDDFASGGSGNDDIIGGEGDDFLCGDQGYDELWGENGDDMLFGGGDPRDRIAGGNGNDIERKEPCPSSFPVTGDWDGDSIDDVGFYIDSLGIFILHGAPEVVVRFGYSGAHPIVGDWNGEGRDRVGVFDSNLAFYFIDEGSFGWTGQTAGELGSQFGLPGDQPIVGDWNGNGADQFGTYRNNQFGGFFYLDEGERGWTGTTAAELGIQFGLPGDIPIVGDWDGNQIDDVGVFRVTEGWGTYFIDEGARGWTGANFGELYGYSFGVSGDEPIVGDWNGDGQSQFGVVRNEAGIFHYYLDEGLRGWFGEHASEFGHNFGRISDQPIVGDWNGDGTDGFGIIRHSSSPAKIYCDYGTRGYFGNYPQEIGH